MITSLCLFAGLSGLAVPAHASFDAGQEALQDYARARLADSDGALAESLESYRRALALDPDSLVLALRSYRQAIESGDRVLALRAAHRLDRDMALPPDGPLLLLSEALQKRDLAKARLLTQRLISERHFAFLAPVVESWISLSERKYVPPALPQDRDIAALTRRYLADHQALQYLAMGDADNAMPFIEQALSLRTNTLPGFRMTAASRLADLGHKDAALALLNITNKDAAALRQTIESGRKPKWQVRTAAQGYARLLMQLAEDLSGETSRSLALSIARIASFADPAADEYRIAVARQLLAMDHPQFALQEMAAVKPRSVFANMANDVRISAVLAAGDQDRALVMAQAAAAAMDADANDYARLAGLLSRRDDFAAAADAYQKAIDLFGEKPVPWSLYLLKGGALEQAGRWDEAKAELEKAEKIAPNEPIILNYLGYAQIERRQNVDSALALIEKASDLKPDDPAITDSLGWAHYVNGDVKKAIPVLERAVLGAPDDATVNEHLGDAYWAAGRRFEARYSWNAAYIYADDQGQGRIAKKIELGLRPDFAAP
ncbi:MAG: tetratricopeptide repeat protein [Alphaproteobacteria bacterium]|nr:tetratricopeptide repeat protein [Alphaproteobacteria bacterium]